MREMKQKVYERSEEFNVDKIQTFWNFRRIIAKLQLLKLVNNGLRNPYQGNSLGKVKYCQFEPY